MPVSLPIIIVICSGLALSICLRELIREAVDTWSKPTARHLSRDLGRSVRHQMKSVEYKMTGRVSDQWLESWIERARTAGVDDGETMNRVDYVAWLGLLSVIAFGGLVAGFAHLASLV